MKQFGPTASQNRKTVNSSKAQATNLSTVSSSRVKSTRLSSGRLSASRGSYGNQENSSKQIQRFKIDNAISHTDYIPPLLSSRRQSGNNRNNSSKSPRISTSKKIVNISIENNQPNNGMIILSKKQPNHATGFMSPSGPQDTMCNMPFKTDSKTEQPDRQANFQRQPRSRAQIEQSMRQLQQLPPFQDLSNINMIKNPYYMCKRNQPQKQMLQEEQVFEKFEQLETPQNEINMNHSKQLSQASIFDEEAQIVEHEEQIIQEEVSQGAAVIQEQSASSNGGSSSREVFVDDEDETEQSLTDDNHHSDKKHEFSQNEDTYEQRTHEKNIDSVDQTVFYQNINQSSQNMNETVIKMMQTPDVIKKNIQHQMEQLHDEQQQEQIQIDMTQTMRDISAIQDGLTDYQHQTEHDEDQNEKLQNQNINDQGEEEQRNQYYPNECQIGLNQNQYQQEEASGTVQYQHQKNSSNSTGHFIYGASARGKIQIYNDDEENGELDEECETRNYSQAVPLVDEDGNAAYEENNGNYYPGYQLDQNGNDNFQEHSNYQQYCNLDDNEETNNQEYYQKNNQYMDNYNENFVESGNATNRDIGLPDPGSSTFRQPVMQMSHRSSVSTNTKASKMSYLSRDKPADYLNRILAGAHVPVLEARQQRLTQIPKPIKTKSKTPKAGGTRTIGIKQNDIEDLRKMQQQCQEALLEKKASKRQLGNLNKDIFTKSSRNSRANLKSLPKKSTSKNNVSSKNEFKKKASQASFGNYDTSKSQNKGFMSGSFYNQQSQMTANLPTVGTNDQSGYLLQYRDAGNTDEQMKEHSYQAPNEQFIDDAVSNNYATTPVKEKMQKLSLSRRSKSSKQVPDKLAQIKSKHAVNTKDQQRGLQSNYQLMQDQLNKTQSMLAQNTSFNTSQILNVTNFTQNFREGIIIEQDLDDDEEQVTERVSNYQLNQPGIITGNASIDHHYFSPAESQYKALRKDKSSHSIIDEAKEYRNEFKSNSFSQAGAFSKIRNSASMSNLNTQLYASSRSTRDRSGRANKLRSSSQTKLGMNTTLLGQAGFGTASSISFDPMKKSIIANHMSHKGRVTTLQMQFASQKQQSKKMIAEKILKAKTTMVQVRKKTKQFENGAASLFEANKELTVSYNKIQDKIGRIVKKKETIIAEQGELQKDIEEIAEFRDNLREELESEIQLKNDIQSIALKYKKLIVEQRKEKEQLAKQLAHQRKIMGNLQARRETLFDDNNKIYDDFQKTVSRDKRNKQKVTKQCVIGLNKEDQQVIGC